MNTAQNIAIIIAAGTGLVGAASGFWAVVAQSRQAQRQRRWEADRAAIELKRRTAGKLISASEKLQWSMDRVGRAMRARAQAQAEGDVEGVQRMIELRNQQTPAMFEAMSNYEDASAEFVIAWKAPAELLVQADAIREKAPLIGSHRVTEEEATETHAEIRDARARLVALMLHDLAEHEARLDAH